MTKIRKTVTTTVVTIEENVNEITHIVCILDRSGSMLEIIDDSIGGFNTFLKQQKELSDDAIITIAIFDDQYEMIYDGVDIKTVNEMSTKIWYPRGSTALYDAIGKTINHVKGKSVTDGKPNKTLVCIVTDGRDNRSSEYSKTDIQKLIKSCENDKWAFIYLAANQNAFEVGASFGISAGNTYSYTATATSVGGMNTALGAAVTKFRSVGTNSVNYSINANTLLEDDKK